MDRFKVLKQIGRGAFGVALLVERKRPPSAPPPQTTTSAAGGKDKAEGAPAAAAESAAAAAAAVRVVIKKIDVSQMTTEEAAEARNEVKVLASLANGNPYIIGYRSAFLEKGSLHIVLDYAENGDLSQVIRKTKTAGKRFRQAQVLDWFVQIASALRFIHARRILHRDLKTQNVFLDREWQVKLGDFGIAKVLRSTTAKANTVVGTPYYLSPELCEDKPYDKKSDVWALGCVLYELCTLRHAFEGRNMCALVLRIVKGTYEPIDTGRRTGYTKEMRVLVDSLLAHNPHSRPTVPDILRKPFIQEHIRQMELHNRLSVEQKIIAGRCNPVPAPGSTGTGTTGKQRPSPGPTNRDPAVGLGTRGRALAARRKNKKAKQRQQKQARRQQQQQRQRGGGHASGGSGGGGGRSVRNSRAAAARRNNVVCSACHRELIPPPNAPRFLCPCGMVQEAPLSIVERPPITDRRKGAGRDTGGKVNNDNNKAYRRKRQAASEGQDMTRDDEMARIRARQKRLLNGLGATTRDQRQLAAAGHGGDGPVAGGWQEDAATVDIAFTPGRAAGAGAIGAATGTTLQNLEGEYQSMLQQYAEWAIDEEEMLVDSFDPEDRPSPARDDHGRVGAADVSRFVAQRTSIRHEEKSPSPSLSERRKLQRATRLRQKEAYLERLKQRQRDYREGRRLVKAKQQSSQAARVSDLRRRVKNAKPTVNVRELRKRFAAEKNSEASSPVVVEGDRASRQHKQQEGQAHRQQERQGQRQQGGGAQQRQRRPRRVRGKRHSGGGTHSNADVDDVPVEIFVQPGFAFDLDDEGAAEDGVVSATSVRKSLPPAASPASSAPSTSSASSASSAHESGVVVVANWHHTNGGSLAASTSSSQESLQEAYARRRAASKRNKRSEAPPNRRARGDVAGRDSIDTLVDSVPGGKERPVELVSSQTLKRPPIPPSERGGSSKSGAAADDDAMPVAEEEEEGEDDVVDDDDDGIDDDYDYDDDDDRVLCMPWEGRSSMLADSSKVGAGESPGAAKTSDATSVHTDTAQSGAAGNSNSSRGELADQLRRCAELHDLQNPKMISSPAAAASGAGKGDNDQRESVSSGPSADPPPALSLGFRCGQIRKLAQERVGADVFQGAYKYVQAVLTGGALDEPDSEDFFCVVEGSGLGREDSQDLLQEILLLVHLETVMARGMPSQ